MACQYSPVLSDAGIPQNVWVDSMTRIHQKWSLGFNAFVIRLVVWFLLIGLVSFDLFSFNFDFFGDSKNWFNLIHFININNTFKIILLFYIKLPAVASNKSLNVAAKAL